MEIRCCPETSKDTNGSTETIELRWFLMQLDEYVILCHIVLKLNELRRIQARFICVRLKHPQSWRVFFDFRGGDDDGRHIGRS